MRFTPSACVLVAPWFFFSLAFFLVGVSVFASATVVAQRISRAAVLLYAFGSASGIMFFNLNFGEEAVSESSGLSVACEILLTPDLVFVSFCYREVQLPPRYTVLSSSKVYSKAGSHCSGSGVILWRE